MKYNLVDTGLMSQVLQQRRVNLFTTTDIWVFLEATATYTFRNVIWISSGARCSSVVDRPLMVLRVVGTIPHDETFELFLFWASAPQLV